MIVVSIHTAIAILDDTNTLYKLMLLQCSFIWLSPVGDGGWWQEKEE